MANDNKHEILLSPTRYCYTIKLTFNYIYFSEYISAVCVAQLMRYIYVSYRILWPAKSISKWYIHLNKYVNYNALFVSWWGWSVPSWAHKYYIHLWLPLYDFCVCLFLCDFMSNSAHVSGGANCSAVIVWLYLYMYIRTLHIWIF